VPRSDDTDTRSTAWLALKSLGWKPTIAQAAVDAALAELGPEPGLDPLIRAALQRCR
jgi:Holliday junction resolvasome RuvABC DNA-binding subunit